MGSPVVCNWLTFKPVHTVSVVFASPDLVTLASFPASDTQEETRRLFMRNETTFVHKLERPLYRFSLLFLFIKQDYSVNIGLGGSEVERREDRRFETQFCVFTANLLIIQHRCRLCASFSTSRGASLEYRQSRDAMFS